MTWLSNRNDGENYHHREERSGLQVNCYAGINDPELFRVVDRRVAVIARGQRQRGSPRNDGVRVNLAVLRRAVLNNLMLHLTYEKR